MIGKEKIWEVQEYCKEKAGCLAAELGISPLVTGILLERGFNDAQKMREFLYGSGQPFYDPFLMKDMERAVSRVEQALANKEQITVYGDYDVDGITASSLLYIYLKNRGAQVNTYIPKRKSECYGLNDDALRTIAESGTTLIVTVDCGISGVKEVEHAPSGMDIIITDHHTVPPVLPAAYAIVNPKQSDCRYPFKQLSGVGVAFKICQAMEQRRTGSKDYWEDLTELAALGTVADIVPLLDENREIVRRGLKAMATTQLVGLRELIKASGCPAEGITSENIGFILAPRLNAVGRLEHAQSAVSLLVTQDEAEAEAIAADLNSENALRQEISRSIMEEAEAQLAQLRHIDTAIVLASEGWHQGVIGIVASRLVDKYHLPTILFSVADGVAKGSCRSIPALNLYNAIAAESDILTQFGGHHQAAGLTLPADKLPEFTARFKKYVREHLSEDDYLPVQKVDCLLGCTRQITVRDLEELSLLEPFGCSNPAPVFAFQNALVHNQRAMGRDRIHLQFTVDKGDYSYRTLMWNRADMLPLMFDNMIADVAFMPRINTWNGETSVQLHGLSVKQKITLCDMRHVFDDKKRLLDGFTRTSSGVTVYISREGRLTGDEYIHPAVYGRLPYNEVSDKTVVLYDLPQENLAEITAQLKQSAARNIVLLYNEIDKQAADADLAAECPDRAAMAEAYKQIMVALKAAEAVTLAQLTDGAGKNAIAIMEQLGFIVIEGDAVRQGTIKKCSLEDAPLYVELQAKRQRLQIIYSENMRLSQYELLRG